MLAAPAIVRHIFVAPNIYFWSRWLNIDLIKSLRDRIAGNKYVEAYAIRIKAKTLRGRVGI